MLQMMGCLVYC